MAETTFAVGMRVRVKLSAEDIGHLYPARFRAFRDSRMVGHIIDIAKDPNDPHPVEVEFGNNPLTPERLWFWWDELEPAVPVQPGKGVADEFAVGMRVRYKFIDALPSVVIPINGIVTGITSIGHVRVWWADSFEATYAPKYLISADPVQPADAGMDELQQAREAYKTAKTEYDRPYTEFQWTEARDAERVLLWESARYVTLLEADREALTKRVGELEAGLRELYAAAVVVERGIPVATEGWHHDLFAATGNAFHLLHTGDGEASSDAAASGG